MERSHTQHPEGTPCVGAAQEVAMEGGGGAGSLGKKYCAVVQAVILFGAETWVILAPMA